MNNNRPKSDDKYSLDWLGCNGCAYNVGKPGWPVCDHPNGVKLVYGSCCIHRTTYKEKEPNNGG
jgi:hypothetical protein